MGMLSALVHLVILPALCAQPVHQWTVQRGGSRDDRGHALQVQFRTTSVLFSEITVGRCSKPLEGKFLQIPPAMSTP